MLQWSPRGKALVCGEAIGTPPTNAKVARPADQPDVIASPQTQVAGYRPSRQKRWLPLPSKITSPSPAVQGPPACISMQFCDIPAAQAPNSAQTMGLYGQTPAKIKGTM